MVNGTRHSIYQGYFPGWFDSNIRILRGLGHVGRRQERIRRGKFSGPGRIGVTGFGGPPAHIALLRELCVQRRRWLSDAEFERAVAAANMLPGPASTQLAIYCAWRLRGPAGALLGGLGFVLPGLIAILALSALFLAGSCPV